jgi:O-antigen biosynthesis protein WbqP
MRIDTPKYFLTHQYKNPKQWITPLGRFLRKTTLDELPKLFNILREEMSIIVALPALCNQNYLISERDKYGVNDLRPGVSGWAQINPRDTFPLKMKSYHDEEYVKKQYFSFGLYVLFLLLF